MSLSEHFQEIQAVLFRWSMEFVACLTYCGPDLVTSISSVPNCRSGSQEWLFNGPNVCVVTMALLQPIVTQNMCFYGHNVDHCHVPSIFSCQAAEDVLF